MRLATKAAPQGVNGDQPSESVPRPKKFALVERALSKETKFEDLHALVEIASWCDHKEARFRNQHAAYYTDVLDAFKKANKGSHVWVHGSIHGAVYLHGDGRRLDIKVDPRLLNFNWTKASKVLYATEALQQDVHLWLRLSPDRQPVMERLAALASRVMSSLAGEAGSHPVGPRTATSNEFQADIQAAERDLKELEVELEAAAQRAALATYAQGMAWGIGIIAVLAACIAAVFQEYGVRFDQEIALITGALGAVVSVLQRMTAGKLRIDYRAAGVMVRTLGMVRPLLGAVFGMVVFALIEGGFLPWVDPPSGSGAYAAFLAILGFLSGFNERFAQDMLGHAGKSIEPPLGQEQQPAGKPA